MPVILSRKGGGAGGSGAPSGPAGGDLAGTYPNPTLAAGLVLFDAYALLRDEKAAGTAGGTFTAGAWRTRTLNTEAFDTDGIVALVGTTQFTLAAGSYYILARAPAVIVNLHKAKIANITDTTDALIGSSSVASSASNGFSDAIVQGRITIAGAKTFELQHQGTVSRNTDGFGIATNVGVVEVYAEVMIYREAS